MQLNELREYQIEFEKKRSEIPSKFKELFKKREQFTKDYSIKAISSFELDDYVIGKGQLSFCYRIENELNEWGNIHGSPAKKFGIYFGVEGNDKIKKYRIGKGQFGTSVDTAFRKVKDSIIELIENEDNLTILKNNPISPMFKGKILSIYHPDKFLNTFSDRYLNYFINMLGLENNSKSAIDKQNILLELKKKDSVMKEWSVFEFNDFLYSSFGTPNNDLKEGDLSKELRKFKSEDFPPIETVKFEFIDLKTDHLPANEGGKNIKRQKNDYSVQSRRYKRIGDRGEQIVVMAERDALSKNGRSDLAQKVDHISKRDDSAGFDIQSFDLDGKEKYIEVKSTVKDSGINDMYISSNELSTAKSMNNFYFYVVYNVGGKNPKIWKIKGDDFLNDANIEKCPILYRINYKTK
jgi:hypothetical protein